MKLDFDFSKRGRGKGKKFERRGAKYEP